MQLETAISSFFIEFSKLEVPVLGVALRSLSKDSAFVEQSEKLLDVEARFTLLTRLGAARGIPSGVMQRLGIVVSRARKLRERRDQLARNLMVAEQEPAIPSEPAALLPVIAQIDAYTAETVELQHALGAITEKLNQHLTAIRA